MHFEAPTSKPKLATINQKSPNWWCWSCYFSCSYHSSLLFSLFAWFQESQWSEKEEKDAWTNVKTLQCIRNVKSLLLCFSVVNFIILLNICWLQKVQIEGLFADLKYKHIQKWLRNKNKVQNKGSKSTEEIEAFIDSLSEEQTKKLASLEASSYFKMTT